jgi:inhibitor of cysteine peptidase
MDFLLTSAANGQTVSLHPGATGELRLPESPTTGYRWTLESAPPNLTIGEEDFTPFAPAPFAPAPGGGGERRWSIQAVSPGSGALALKRWREWEGEASVIERFQVTLAITP